VHFSCVVSYVARSRVASGVDVGEHIIAGFNLPVSVYHLHLHVLVPPLSHLKGFQVRSRGTSSSVVVFSFDGYVFERVQHPRFHPYAKVLSDLRRFGRVVSYHERKQPEEGQLYYDRHIVRNHRTVEELLLRHRSFTPQHPQQQLLQQ
jgi:hypothetical protein